MLLQIGQGSLVQGDFPEVSFRGMCRFEVPAQERMLPYLGPRDFLSKLVRWRVGVTCRRLQPATLSLPRIKWDSNALACGRIGPAKVYLLPKGTSRTERSQHYRVRSLFTPKRRKYDTCRAVVMNSLLDGAKQHGVWTDLQESIMSI